MKFPVINPRRTLNDPDGKVTTTVSNFVKMNRDECVWLLDNFEAALKAAYMMGVIDGEEGFDPEVSWPNFLAELRRTGINED